LPIRGTIIVQDWEQIVVFVRQFKSQVQIGQSIAFSVEPTLGNWSREVISSSQPGHQSSDKRVGSSIICEQKKQQSATLALVADRRVEREPLIF
jgi:hypothetical protein